MYYEENPSPFWNSELERLTAMTRGGKLNIVAIDLKGDINTLRSIQRALLRKQELVRRKVKFLPAQVYRSIYAGAGVPLK